MKLTPILYSGPMALASVEERKTQTRRVANPQPGPEITRVHIIETEDFSAPTARWSLGWSRNGRPWMAGGTITCPYGTVGDQLWGKETFFPVHLWKHAPLFAAVEPDYLYRADYAYREHEHSVIGCHHWKPSIFMPRTASRITQEITCVQLQRLQDISEEDCIAEGVPTWIPCGNRIPLATKIDDPVDKIEATPREAYRFLWNSINLRPSPTYRTNKATRKKVIDQYTSCPWSFEDFDAAYPGVRSGTENTVKYRGKWLFIYPNPWVWAITFKKIQP